MEEAPPGFHPIAIFSQGSESINPVPQGDDPPDQPIYLDSGHLNSTRLYPMEHYMCVAITLP